MPHVCVCPWSRYVHIRRSRTRVRKKACMKKEWCACVRRSQLEVVPRNSTGGGRPMSTASAGGSLGRGSRALHLQHHQSSLSALHMTANHTGTVDRRRSSLRVTYHLDSTRAWSARDRARYSMPLPASPVHSSWLFPVRQYYRLSESIVKMITFKYSEQF